MACGVSESVVVADDTGAPTGEKKLYVDVSLDWNCLQAIGDTRPGGVRTTGIAYRRLYSGSVPPSFLGNLVKQELITLHRPESSRQRSAEPYRCIRVCRGIGIPRDAGFRKVHDGCVSRAEARDVR